VSTAVGVGGDDVDDGAVLVEVEAEEDDVVDEAGGKDEWDGVVEVVSEGEGDEDDD
jgi:hypothetical protein